MSEEPHPAVLCAEEQLQLLAEMAQFGMGLIRGLKVREAEIDTVEAFARISRAVRLTFALQTKTHKELRVLKGEIVALREVSEAEAAEAARVVREKAGSRRKSEVRRLVLAVAESESESLEDFKETWDRLEEKLDRNGLYRNIGDWETRYAVERLCDDLGLEPDWDRWTGEGWADLPLRSGGRGPRPRSGGAEQPTGEGGEGRAPAFPPTVATVDLRSPSLPFTSVSNGEIRRLGNVTVNPP